MRLTAAAILLSVSAMPAMAQDSADRRFQGVSITAIGGVDDSQSYGGPRTGAVYGGQVGYDWQSSNLVFGVEGEITDFTGKHCTSIYKIGGGADLSCVRYGRDLYAGGRVGTTLGASTLVYAKAGYSNARLSFDYRPGATGAINMLGSTNIDGFRVGAGVEHRLIGNITLKAEYRYSNYEGSYSRHQGVAGIGFRF